jgi:hypothetical protein
MEVGGQLFAPLTLYQQERTQVSNEHGAGWAPESRTERFGEDNILPEVGFEPRTV